ncbi:GNAT family N-acetyltransferase [Bizionia paragorgiae]|jgi:ribosomal protein S18 acetylase RimI-like enzyme|uniref:GNAT family N-acetyltransferase n=1 Tax=Bizionia paragorgiae TaxID=283786 RepID=UPI00299F40A6|nr:GNAT family N-acetyltransferase [Bizionia paragorgiae]MDX1271475.1 GNAT family N-acetyltransferase [Bizionia paragorgiae]
MQHLLNNHICFLKQNRGTLSFENKNIRISSPFKTYSITIVVHEQETTCTSEYVFLPNWSTNTNPLTHYNKDYDLTYMLGDSEQVKNWSEHPNLLIKQVKTQADIDLFSQVQASGFCETEAIYNRWFPFLKQKNDEGLLYKNQYYFMASINKQTVATCLIVDSDSVYGIYGVATAPQFRKQGIATSLMKAAITSCLSKKEQLLTLQTVKDSNAEKLYQTLGFKEDFNSQILKKEI